MSIIVISNNNWRVNPMVTMKKYAAVREKVVDKEIEFEAANYHYAADKAERLLKLKPGDKFLVRALSGRRPKGLAWWHSYTAR